MTHTQPAIVAYSTKQKFGSITKEAKSRTMIGTIGMAANPKVEEFGDVFITGESRRAIGQFAVEGMKDFLD